MEREGWQRVRIEFKRKDITPLLRILNTYLVFYHTTPMADGRTRLCIYGDSVIFLLKLAEWDVGDEEKNKVVKFIRLLHEHGRL